jgi:hypothetical protein
MIYIFPSNISLLQDDVMKYHKEDFANFLKLMKLLSEKLKEKKGILCVTGSKVAAISNSKLCNPTADYRNAHCVPVLIEKNVNFLNSLRFSETDGHCRFMDAQNFSH